MLIPSIERPGRVTYAGIRIILYYTREMEHHKKNDEGKEERLLEDDGAIEVIYRVTSKLLVETVRGAFVVVLLFLLLCLPLVLQA